MNLRSVGARMAAGVVAAAALAIVASTALLWGRVPGVVLAAVAGVQAAAALAVLATGLLLRRWHRSTEQALVAQVEAIGQGRFEERVQQGAEEWGPLTRAVNVAAVRLAAQVADRDRRLGELQTEVSVDDVTGLAARAPFMDRLGALLRGADPQASGGVALLRIDDLAGLNQRTGRDRTDELLKHVATLLRLRAVRLGAADQVLVARLNGADFAVLASRVDAATLDEWAGSLAGALQQLKAQQLTDRPRVGWIAASVFHPGEGVGAVMSRVDQGLQTSESSNAAWQLIRSGQTGPVISVQQWRHHIDSALDTGRIELGFQPLPGADGRLHHRRAVVRVALEDGRVFGPEVLVPAALRTGRIAELDLRAAELALAAAAEGEVAVAVSAQSIQRPAFVSRLATALQDAGPAARRLRLEVEGHDEPHLLAALAPLAALLATHHTPLGLAQVHGLPEDLTALRRIGVGYLRLALPLCRGLAGDAGAGRRRVVQLLVQAAAGEQLAVFAGDTGSAADAHALLAAGVACCAMPDTASPPAGHSAAAVPETSPATPAAPAVAA